MSPKIPEQAHPDTRPLPPERSPITGDQAHLPKRRFLGIKLNERGRQVRNVALATAITLGGTALGANILQGSQPGGHPAETPSAPPAGLTQPSTRPETTPTIKPETSPNIITVGELNPNKPPTEKLNAIVMIKINNEKDIPAPRTDPNAAAGESNIYGNGWSSISELNGQSVAKAVDSNGQQELVITDPLITYGVNPDNGQTDTGTWITAVGPDGKPLYIDAMSQAVQGIVMVAPQVPSGQRLFEPVPLTANALDYGKITFQEAPKLTPSPVPND